MKVRDFASKIGMASCEMPVEIKKGMDVIEKNNCYYSRTTSKIQNMIKAAFNLINCKERKCFLMINGRIKVHFETLREEEA